MVATSTVPTTLGDPIKHLASDALVASRWRQNRPEVAVTLAGGLVVILSLSPVPVVEHRYGRRSEVRQSRVGLITVPDPARESTVTVRGGGDALFLTFPGTPPGAPIRTRFVDEEPVLARLATRALALLHAGQADPLATGQLRLAFDAALLGAPTATAARGGLSEAQLRRARGMIDAAVEGAVPRSPSLAELSREAGVSLHHFAREFRRSTGESPYAYSLRRRVERARELLVAADEPVSTVGHRCGFASPAHFVQRFRALVGVPPGRFRALVRA